MTVASGKDKAAGQARHRMDIASRLVLAVGGGYALAALASASLALALPLPRAQAVLAATMLSFALYCALAVWAFCAASAGRAWKGAALLAAPMALHLMLAGRAI